MDRFFLKVLSLFLVASLIVAPVQIAQASDVMVSTDAAIAYDQAELNREQLLAMLDSDAVVQALEIRGVTPADARARVAALSDEELRTLGTQLDSLPAGGNVVGVLFSVFVILLVTDLLGLTDVFPFTRN
jgi:hypothetical protein